MGHLGVAHQKSTCDVDVSDESDSQQFTEQLEINQQTLFNRPWEMEKIQKGIDRHSTSWTTMLHHTRQSRFATWWKHSARKLLNRLRWPLVCIDASRTCWVTLWFVRRCEKMLDVWFAAKGEDFYRRGVHKFPERWEKCVTSYGAYFEQNTFYHFSELNVFF